jgi:LytS/YehU family sensor histidine kinase
LENSWQSAGPNRQVTYSGLKPGNYIFQVQARKHHGNWSKNQAYFQFRINVPFWQTLWFILLIIFIVIALLIIIFYRRMMLIRNRAEQKFKIESQMAGLEMKALRAQMNPHFIFNALNSIQAFIVQDQADLALKYQNKFAKLLRQILENADKNLIPLSNELNALQIYIEIEALRLGEDFKYAIRIENNVDVEDCLIPPLILQPFVENSLWHGLSVLKSQKSLEISIARTEQNIICKIKDNGIGRKQAALNRASHPLPHNSKGLNVTEKRIELLHSDILFPVMFSDLMDANSAPLGTEVTITLPLIKRV